MQGVIQAIAEDHATFARNGFQILPEFLAGAECDALVAELSALWESRQTSARRPKGGLRNLLRDSPAVAKIAVAESTLALVRELIAGVAFPVRAIFFDKTPAANWSVPWHQDLAIAVAERIDTPGFGPWSVKEGIVHVQPPCEILADMLALRIHLDVCDANNGALQVLPGSHQAGELSTEVIRCWADNTKPVVCETRRGGALAMRPLLLHASSAATEPTHRRVLHIEYAARELPNGLQWFER